MGSTIYSKYRLYALLMMSIPLAVGHEAAMRYYFGNASELAHAATDNDINKINKCLKYGADVNGYRASGWYNGVGNTPLIEAISMSSSVETIQYLIKMGASVNQIGGYNYTPAHAAARRGNMGIIQVLADSGADFHISDRANKVSAFDVAMQCGHPEAADIIKQILSKREKQQ